jgi:hypothetical protein
MATSDDLNTGLMARLIETMQSAVRAYQRGELDLRRLIADLDGAIEAAREFGPSPSVHELRRDWGRLEIIYSIQRQERRTELTPDEAGEVDEAAARLAEQLAAAARGTAIG